MKPTKCDHTQPKVFTVTISVGKDKTKKPKVDKETVVACFEDDIVFKCDDSDFKIIFQGDSPFGKNLNSEKRRAQGKVKVKPKGAPIYKYKVEVPDYPVLDPVIIITEV